MNLRIPLAALVLGAMLTACSGGPPRRVHPSTASIQQLAVEADGPAQRAGQGALCA